MNPSQINVLVGCEFSQTVMSAFLNRGYNAYSCDLLPSEGAYPERHLQGDIFHYINNPPTGVEKWHLAIFHPPCTYLANSGVRWLYTQADRWENMIDGAVFFRRLLMSDIPYIAVENPIMHRYAKKIIGYEPDQCIQPYLFGHTEKKNTCLWLKNLPSLVSTNNVLEETNRLPMKEQQRVHYLPPSTDRWKQRSVFYSGIAEAMAEQYGNYILSTYTA